MIFCVGQGAWEYDGAQTLRNLKRIFDEKKINAWCDFWGSDVSHDWYWWFRELRYFLRFYWKIRVDFLDMVWYSDSIRVGERLLSFF